MNVLQALPRLDLGGVETGVVDFCRFLKKHGHKAIVVSGGGRLAEELLREGIKHYQMDIGRKSLFTFFPLIFALRRIILAEKIDIVHARSRVPAWICFFACFNTPAKFITTAHGYYSVHFFSRIMSYGKYVICPSRRVALHMKDDFHTLPEKIVIIPRGIDIEKFTFVAPEKKPLSSLHLVYLGRISPVKGIEYFIEAVNKLVPDYPQIKAKIFGSAGRKHKAYEEFLKKLVRKYRLEKHIEFCGRQDAASALAQADILVLPSVVPESFGRVIVEAQASGVFVIATSLGAAAEIIEEGKTGLLVNAFDALAIAEAVKRPVRDRAFYNQVVRQAYEKAVRQYRLELMAEATLAVYRQAQQKLNILVIKLSALGDVVLGLVGIKALREHFPAAKIVAVTEFAFRDILASSGLVDKVIGFDKNKSRLHQLKRLSGILRHYAFDFSVDFQNNFFSHLLSYFSLIPHRYGYNRKGAFLLNHKASYLKNSKLGPAQSQAKVLALLGVEVKDKLPALKVKEGRLRFFQKLWRQNFGPEKKVVLLNVGSSFDWQTKDLKIADWRKIVEFLLSRNACVVISGADYLQEKAKAVSRGYDKSQLLNLCGQTSLLDLLAVVASCDLVITSDNALFHIAVALQKKTLVFFGPTDPLRHSLAADNVWLARRGDLACLGCYRKKCRHWKCMDFDFSYLTGLITQALQKGEV